MRRIHGILYRIHHSDRDCLYFSRNGDGRFDDPLKKYGVFYAALKPEGAFAEVFLRRLSRMLVMESDLNQRSLSCINCNPIECVDLTGPGLRRLSCDNRIATEKPYRVAGLWSRAIFEHPQQPGGIIYLSRHNPQFKCVARFDSRQSRLRIASTETLMTGLHAVWAIDQISKYNLAIQPFP